MLSDNKLTITLTAIMKNFNLLLLTFILILAFNPTFANHSEHSDSISPDDQIYVIVDTMPLFKNTCTESYLEQKKCSDKAMLEHIYKNVTYPYEARINSIEGVVVVSFIVQKDGSLTNIEIVRNPGGGLGEDVVRVIQEMPKWTAGILNDKPVAVKFNMPVRYRLETPEQVEKSEKQERAEKRKRKKRSKNKDN